MKTKQQEIIDDATHMLVASHVDVLRTAKLVNSWPAGYYAGRRAAAHFVVKHAAKRSPKKVAGAIREWVAYFKKQGGFSPVAV